ncbi:DUF3277 family protein [Roseiarcaceae bacterium H3SJ34-1]|uniref:phage protein n=1 Tax=Terripilifer ovatus TaxID=3032367 RepID=UPI003AB95CD3|nr:DUF3277 family protein [Roseiarcaceae bacterium H3SJ34-1]
MDNVVLQIDGVRIQGFADGDDVIKLERSTELGTPLIGADGASIVSISADRSAKLTLKLLQTSPANQQGLAPARRRADRPHVQHRLRRSELRRIRRLHHGHRHQGGYAAEGQERLRARMGNLLSVLGTRHH